MTTTYFIPKWLKNAKAEDLTEQSGGYGGYGARFTDLVKSDNADEIGIRGEMVRETEKAVNIETEICDCLGNSRSWKIWLPKSQILRTA